MPSHWRTILIVGGTGRIGSALARGLGAEYRILRTSRHATPAGAAHGLYPIDVGGSPTALTRLIGARRVDTVVAVGAMGTEAPFEETAQANIRGAWNVFEAARLGGARRVVFASTNHVYDGYRGPGVPGVLCTPDLPPAPGGLYSASKVFGEALGQAYAHRYGLSCIALRIGNFPADDRPRPTSVDRWISARDMCALVRGCIEADPLPYAVLNAVSESDTRWMEIESARRLVGYVPQDNASRILERLPPEPPSPPWRPRFGPPEPVDPRPLPEGRPRLLLTGEARTVALLQSALAGRAQPVTAHLEPAADLDALREAARDCDGLIFAVPPMREGEFDGLLHAVVRGAYHALEAAREARVSRAILLVDWTVMAGYRGRCRTGETLREDALPYPVGLAGAAHVWCEALGYTYRRRYGLPITVLRAGDLVPEGGRPAPGLEDVHLRQADLAALLGNCLSSASVYDRAMNAISPGPTRWLPSPV